MKTALRILLITIGLAAITIGLFAPESVQEAAAAWLSLP